jgi:HPt (histidine-containing phosphotransfer) domain-containing protein
MKEPAVAPQVPPIADEAIALPLDLQSAMPRFNNDRAFFTEMCQEFMQHLPARMAEFKAALEAKDAVALTRVAHNLKGIAANFSAGPLIGLAAELEARGKQDNLTDASLLVDSIQVEANRLCEYLVGLGVKVP